MNKIDQIRTVLNIAFMIGAVASVVLFFTDVDQTIFFYVCATSIIIKMAEEGVSCNVHYKPLPMHTAYKALGFDIKNYPNAYAHYVNEITLPLHTCLTDEEVWYIIEKYTEVLKEYI